MVDDAAPQTTPPISCDRAGRGAETNSAEDGRHRPRTTALGSTSFQRPLVQSVCRRDGRDGPPCVGVVPGRAPGRPNHKGSDRASLCRLGAAASQSRSVRGVPSKAVALRLAFVRRGVAGLLLTRPSGPESSSRHSEATRLSSDPFSDGQNSLEFGALRRCPFPFPVPVPFRGAVGRLSGRPGARIWRTGSGGFSPLEGGPSWHDASDGFCAEEPLFQDQSPKGCAPHFLRARSPTAAASVCTNVPSLLPPRRGERTVGARLAASGGAVDWAPVRGDAGRTGDQGVRPTAPRFPGKPGAYKLVGPTLGESRGGPAQTTGKDTCEHEGEQDTLIRQTPRHTRQTHQSPTRTAQPGPPKPRDSEDYVDESVSPNMSDNRPLHEHGPLSETCPGERFFPPPQGTEEPHSLQENLVQPTLSPQEIEQQALHEPFVQRGFPTDMCFPTKGLAGDLDFYAPLAFTIPRYGATAPLFVLPPACPSALSSSTLCLRKPFLPLGSRTLSRTPALKINLALARADPNFREFSQIHDEIFKVDTFRRLLVRPGFLSRRPVFSRGMLPSLPIMLEDGIAEVVDDISTLHHIAPWFGIVKDDLLFRLVENLKSFNKAFDPTFPMQLDQIHKFLFALLAIKDGYLFEEDAKGYFYLFPIPPEVRNYFGALLGGMRGKFVPVRLCVLSQGFTKSPAIAQRFSLGLCRTSVSGLRSVTLMPWLDNFLGSAPTLQAASTLRDTFRSTCQRFDVTLKPNLTQPKQQLTALSISMDTRSQSFKMSDDMIKNIVDFMPDPQAVVTGRIVLSMIGRLLWVSYVMRYALCYYPKMMHTMSELCSHVDTPNYFNEIYPRSQELNDDIAQLLTLVLQNTPICIHDLTFDPSKRHDLWADASTHLGAWVIETHGVHDEEFSTCGFPPQLRQAAIFYKELFMAREVILAACSRIQDAHLLLLEDNSTTVMVLNKGHSLNPFTNDILTEIFTACKRARNKLFQSWISTHLQRADRLTRTYVGRSMPGPVHPITLSCTIPRT